MTKTLLIFNLTQYFQEMILRERKIWASKVMSSLSCTSGADGKGKKEKDEAAKISLALQFHAC